MALMPHFPQILRSKTSHGADGGIISAPKAHAPRIAARRAASIRASEVQNI